MISENYSIIPGWFVGHCDCGTGYFCFNRPGVAWLDDGEAPTPEALESAAKDEAARLGYYFVYIDVEPSRLCLCGAVLNMLPAAVQASARVM